MPISLHTRITVAIAWCLAWGTPLPQLHQMRQVLASNQSIETLPEFLQLIIQQVQETLALTEFPQTLAELKIKNSTLWEQQTQIGLVYGGATKIKQYVFESAKLQDIRGASALLDRINLVDLPAFFSCETDPEYPQCVLAADYAKTVRENWLAEHYPRLSEALIPELIVYSTGGNILAFCPASMIDDLASAIEKRYTQETLTANACAVGKKFKLLELQFGMLQDPIESTPWLDWLEQHKTDPIAQACYSICEPEDFKNRKSFNELVKDLAIRFYQRRSGNSSPNRVRRRYPPRFETHPYLRRDQDERRSSVMQARELPGEPWMSEASARKRLIGQKTKRTQANPFWYREAFDWEPGQVQSWVAKFERFLQDNQLEQRYNLDNHHLKEAQSLREISNASKGFVAYIYADGNNMGSYIQRIKTAQAYRQFSQDILDATERSVYQALADHLCAHELRNLSDADLENRNGDWIHPFEILTIGGDDVFLVVPAHKAIAIAKTIAEVFEHNLRETGRYLLNKPSHDQAAHRYRPDSAVPSACELSMSIGVLITADKMPIYYAERLTNQLLKSAKARAKALKQHNYHSGTVDFLVMKAVTMISSSVQEFRTQALIKPDQRLKLYAAPYTLHELEGLLETVKSLKQAKFPRSQLYQIRSLLERGKRTSILNYRYFRTRLKTGKSELKAAFEDGWCMAKTNEGNLAPWMYDPQEAQYETIWHDLVDLYPFLDLEDAATSATSSMEVNA